MKIQEAGWTSAYHRSRVVASCFHRGDELGEQLIPFALPLLQLLDTPEHLGVETFHVKDRPQGFFSRPHLELCGAEATLYELHDALWFFPAPPTLCRHIWQSRGCGDRAWSAKLCGPLGRDRG
jgi:hypothetical protein